MTYYISNVVNNKITISDENNKSYDGYTVIITEDQIVINFECMLTEYKLNIQICLKCVVNNNEINLNNIMKIDKVTITFNNLIKIYEKVKFTKSMKKYLLLFNVKTNHKKVIDTCLFKINLPYKSKKQYKFNKLINIITCSEIFKIFRNIDIDKRNDLFLFIYKVIMNSKSDFLDRDEFENIKNVFQKVISN
jgi:hypothetical protein